MDIAVVGTGFIGGVLGRALARAGHGVTFGSRHPGDDDVAGDTTATVASVSEALAQASAAILAIPGSGLEAFAADHGVELRGKLVIDATNRMGSAVANGRHELPSGIRYARAFNTTAGENMAEPEIAGVRCDMFFSAPEDDRAVVEAVIEAVGLRPIYLGPDAEGLVDCLFRVWVALAVTQGQGRRMALGMVGGRDGSS